MMLFEESIKSKYTKQNYISHLNQFKKFSGISNVDHWLNIPSNELQTVLEDYVIYLKHTTSPNSIPSKLRGIRHFFVMNRIKLDWDIICKMFPPKQKTSTLRAYTTGEVQKMLLHTKNSRDKALIHFLASTGARIGVFDHPLLIKHRQKMPSNCTAFLFYAGTVEEYWSFLTPQATKILDVYHNIRKRDGETFKPDTPIFVTSKHNSTQLSWSGARSVIYRNISKTTIRLKHGNRFNVQADHGFRKRFNTILKMDNSVNHNIAEKLMGHKNGLDGVYFTPSLEELFTEFKKVINRLQI